MSTTTVQGNHSEYDAYPTTQAMWGALDYSQNGDTDTLSIPAQQSGPTAAIFTLRRVMKTMVVISFHQPLLSMTKEGKDDTDTFVHERSQSASQPIMLSMGSIWDIKLPEEWVSGQKMAQSIGNIIQQLPEGDIGTLSQALLYNINVTAILVAGKVTSVNVIMGGVNLSIVDALSNPMFVYVPVAAQQELIEDIVWPIGTYLLIKGLPYQQFTHEGPKVIVVAATNPVTITPQVQEGDLFLNTLGRCGEIWRNILLNASTQRRTEFLYENLYTVRNTPFSNRDPGSSEDSEKKNMDQVRHLLHKHLRGLQGGRYDALPALNVIDVFVDELISMHLYHPVYIRYKPLLG
ncbi:hypothetical protein C8Q80DRAFT_1125417 [Daedaleopsis nitida]|nr:hypothetical protein C8Q80DRAFT_1125417 [Daedaleopsis nitida]